MIEDDTESKVTWSYQTLGRVIWIVITVSFICGLILQLGGISPRYRDFGEAYLWWGGLSIIDTISGIVYYLLTSAILIALSVYLVLIRKEVGNIGIGTSITTLFSGISWGTHFILHRMADDLMDVSYAIMYWSIAMVLLGITFFLMGIIYLKRESAILTRLTAVSFLIVGFIGIIVGYIGGFTLLPWFSVYEFPWVTSLAIIPCCLALYANK